MPLRFEKWTVFVQRVCVWFVRRCKAKAKHLQRQVQNNETFKITYWSIPLHLNPAAGSIPARRSSIDTCRSNFSFLVVLAAPIDYAALSFLYKQYMPLLLSGGHSLPLAATHSGMIKWFTKQGLGYSKTAEVPSWTIFLLTAGGTKGASLHITKGTSVL